MPLKQNTALADLLLLGQELVGYPLFIRQKWGQFHQWTVDNDPTVSPAQVVPGPLHMELINEPRGVSAAPAALQRLSVPLYFRCSLSPGNRSYYS